MVEYTLKGIPQKNICMEGFDGVVWLEWLITVTVICRKKEGSKLVSNFERSILSLIIYNVILKVRPT
jgi:hypothetical protein